jgi:hypothetical protein
MKLNSEISEFEKSQFKNVQFSYSPVLIRFLEKSTCSNIFSSKYMVSFNFAVHRGRVCSILVKPLVRQSRSQIGHTIIFLESLAMSGAVAYNIKPINATHPAKVKGNSRRFSGAQALSQKTAPRIFAAGPPKANTMRL